MLNALALLSYGLILIGGYITVIFWGSNAYKRMRTMPTLRSIRDDKLSMLTTFMVVKSLGISVFFTARTWKFAVKGLSTVYDGSVSSIGLLIGLYIMAFGYVGLIWALYCSKRAWIWKAYIGLSLLWVALSIGWVWVDPFHNYPFK